ncbi:Glutamine synthetase [bioreactor metagenome]|uniref:Glutamine synthetase n=1 Tax=bioreactor metagenome TaxID=1076179 RepID=A0A645FWR9_9ZZZZ
MDNLPKDLFEAIQLMKADKLVTDTLGKHITDYYCRAKLIEWEKYCMTVHPWELDQYLTTF